MMHRRTWLVLAWCTLVPLPVRAEENGVAPTRTVRRVVDPPTRTGQRVRFAWARLDGAEDCPSESELKNAVRGRLGRDPFAERAVASIEGAAFREVASYRATLVLRTHEGEATSVRELTSRAETCEALGQAVALAVAVVIDPERALAGAEEPVPETSAPPIAEEKADDAAAAPPAPVEVRDHALRGGLWLAGTWTRDVLPGSTFGVSVGGELEFSGPFSLIVGMSFLPEVRRPEGFGFGLTSVLLAPCARLARFGPVESRLCTGVQVGALHAVVFREDRVRPGQRLFVAPDASLRTLFDFHPSLYGLLVAGLALPLPRTRFFVEGSDRTIHRQPFVTARIELGLGMRFR